MSKCKIKLRSSISVILSVLIVLSAAMCVPVTASAATYDSNPNNFDCRYDQSRMTATLTKYKGNSEYVEVPSKINGYRVISMGAIFGDNRKLKGIIVPDTVERINDRAFSGCISLTDVDLGKGVTSIESYAFYNCQNLKAITIPEQVYNLGGYIFNNCLNLKTVYYKAKNISYASSIFNLPSVTDLVIASTVETLPSEAFANYSYLENVVIENGLMTIPYKCFQNCTSLKNVTLPDSVMAIGESAFENCYNLKGMKFPKSLNTISRFAFKNCSSLDILNFNDNLREICDYAFENCSSVKNVIFGNWLNTIGKEVFKNCLSIEKTDLPSSVSSLGESAFEDCTNLKSVTLSEKLKCINDKTFAGCSNLESIDFPDSVSELGQRSFKNCSKLKKVGLGKSITDIDEYAFSGCNSLESIEFPSSAEYIRKNAFENCTNLSSVKLNKGLQSIENYAFYNCVNLKKIEVPSNTSLSDYCLGYYGNNGNDFKIPDFVIRGYYDTYAEWYAKRNGFTFINAAIPEPISVSLSANNITLYVGMSYTLEHTFNPTNAVSDCYWSSTNNRIATVNNNGKVIAKSEGNAIITVKTENGKTSTCRVTVLKTLPTPQITSLTNTANGVVITWDKVAGAYGYRLYYKPASGGWKRFKDTTATSFTDSSVVPNKTETYTIRCLDKDGNTISGFNSNGWSIKYVPVAPTISKLENTSSGIKLNWNKITGVYGYRLYYKPASGGWKRFKDTTATSFTDSGVVPNKTETYTIRCLDKDGNTISGFNSNGWSIKYVPVAPTISKLENTSSGIKLNWNKIAGVYGYRVYQKTSNGWKRIKDTTATSYTDSAVSANQTKTYTIRCIDKNGNTVSGYNSKGWSKKYTAATPKITKLTNTSKGVSVTWNKIAGVYGYRLYRKYDRGSWTKVKDTTSTSFTDSGAKKGKKVTYTVRCIDRKGKTVSGFNSKGWSITRK
nr:leucine-rich repeat protein [uncultured Ruminococcus sp.]